MSKEEFEKRLDVIVNKENDYERFFAIWQVAVEYKQQEIDELKDKCSDLIYAENCIERLKNENNRLEEEIRYLRRKLAD